MMTTKGAGIPRDSSTRAIHVFWLCSKAAARAMCLLLLSTVPVAATATRAHAQFNLQNVLADNATLGQFRAEAIRQWEREKKILRQSCELTSEQDSELANLDDSVASLVNETLNKLTERRGELRLGGSIVRRQPAVTTAQYRTAIEKLCTQYREKLGALLNDTQSATYKAEHQARVEFRRQAHIECLATLIEQKLDLSEGQRKKLAANLSGYDQAEKLYMPFYFQNDTYLPSLPEVLLADVLDKVQLTRYRNFAKTNVFPAQIYSAIGPFD